MKKIVLILMGLFAVFSFTGCETDSAVASRNLSKAADMFEIERRIVFYNGITNDYMLLIQGKCSIEDQHKQLEVTCKVSDSSFKKHFLGLSDNVTYFVEQLETADVSTYHNRIIFKPQNIINDVDLRYDTEEIIKAVTPDSKDK